MNWRKIPVMVFAVIGATSILGIFIALMLPDPDAPSQANYETCVNRASRQAEGSFRIFNFLLYTQCNKLRPKQEIRLFEDLPDNKLNLNFYDLVPEP